MAMGLVEFGFLLIFAATSALALLLMIRQAAFSLIAVNRTPVSHYSHATPAAWPTVSILVAAHNEERVIASCLEHLLQPIIRESSSKSSSSTMARGRTRKSSMLCAPRPRSTPCIVR